jgi:Zn finger protein HypA/HybF involved in hydrogenase expression
MEEEMKRKRSTVTCVFIGVDEWEYQCRECGWKTLKITSYCPTCSEKTVKVEENYSKEHGFSDRFRK